jgi:magnesium chelatase family protein
MVTRVSTVAFEGIEGRAVDVQVQISAGNVFFAIVGLPDKAVAESRERVRSALLASGLALPAKRIIVNLAPADLPKEGSHYDLPIALGIMAAMGAIPSDALDGFTVLGELALDGSITPVAGVLPAAMAANGRGQGLICPAGCGPEAAWASGDSEILAPRSLIQLANHFKGDQVMARPEPAVAPASGPLPDLRDIKGQESAKRVLEIAAAGGHNLLMLWYIKSRASAATWGSIRSAAALSARKLMTHARQSCPPFSQSRDAGESYPTPKEWNTDREVRSG